MRNPEIEARCQRFMDALAHIRKLGLRVIQADERRVTLVLPVQDQLNTGKTNTYLLGGALTTLIDTASAVSTLCVLPEFEIAPTLDLRIDHMKAPTHSQPLYIQAECYRTTRSVMFTRATVYQTSADDPIAFGIGTFMRLGSDVVDTQMKALVEGDIDGDTGVSTEKGEQA
ncbi:MAG: PaaI family thioesterase [Oceanospirillaceae bacterium]|nr:PaaI family thioesterase [Oceanospirillaceae bacterium]